MLLKDHNAVTPVRLEPAAVRSQVKHSTTEPLRSHERHLNVTGVQFFRLQIWGPPGVLGIWGEWLFIFRDLGSTGNYFRGAGEQAHSFGDLGSPAKKQKKIKEKPPFCLIFKNFFCFWGDSPQTDPPL